MCLQHSVAIHHSCAPSSELHHFRSAQVEAGFMMPHVGAIPHSSGADAERITVRNQQYCVAAVPVLQPAEQAEEPGCHILDSLALACSMSRSE
jgi:hypothetical protein